MKDFQEEIKNLKKEIQSLKTRDNDLELILLEMQGHMIIQNQNITSPSVTHDEGNKEIIVTTDEDPYINKIEKMISHKWYRKVKLIILDQIFELIALIDYGTDLNCIQERLIPTQYYKKKLKNP